MSCPDGNCHRKSKQPVYDYNEWGSEESLSMDYKQMRGNCQFNKNLLKCIRPPIGADDKTKTKTDETGYCIDIPSERKCGLNEIGQDYVNYQQQLLNDLKADENIMQNLKHDASYANKLLLFLIETPFYHQAGKDQQWKCNQHLARHIVSHICQYHGVTPKFYVEDKIKKRLTKMGWVFTS